MGAGLSRLSGPAHLGGNEPIAGKGFEPFSHLISASEGELNPTTLGFAR